MNNATGEGDLGAGASASARDTDLKRGSNTENHDGEADSGTRPYKRNRVGDTSENSPAITPEDYIVGWVCALPLEMAAAKGMLDEIHPNLNDQDSADHNNYILGQIGAHKVAIACLPAGIYGTTTAATVAKDLLRTFKSIRFGLMVGIGGAAPSSEHDIRLGDVVVSQPTGTNGGLIQYDRGKTTQEGELQRTGSLNAPPQILLSALGRLQADRLTEESRIPQFLANFAAKIPKKMKKKFDHQGISNDCLYLPEYDHVDPDATCERCDHGQTVQRETRDDTDPEIHYGTIASGNQLIKHGKTRERLRKEFGALCFEMEAAGLQDFPCLVIRGISDYADSHKNKIWQDYAAATAAAFAKELLSVVPSDRVIQEKPIPQLVSIAQEQLQVSMQNLDVSTKYLVEHRRTNRILENCPVDLRIVDEACCNSADVRDSPRCENGTRVRIQQAILQWADEDTYSPFFWLVGPAGTGKSTIARTMADSFAQGGRVVTGYFFKRGEQGRNNTDRLFSTLAMQLADVIPSFRTCLRASLGNLDKDTIRKKELNYQYEKLLMVPLSNMIRIDAGCPPVVVVIDALDECERPEHLPQILTLLLEICNTTQTASLRIRVLFTSRPAPRIVEAFKALSHVRKLVLNQDFSAETKSDIRTFLRVRFGDIKIKRNVQETPWPTAEDLDRLVELAANPEPLFIYASTLCRFVYDEERPRNPKNQLKLWLSQCEHHKSQLHQIYDPILSQALLSHGESEYDQQLQFLGALILLATPLSATSLASLLGMDMDNVNWWLPELHAVLDIPTESHKPLRTLHKSFSDFLLSDDSVCHVKYRVEAAEIHALLADRCIQAMTAGLKQDVCDIRKLDATLDDINSETIDRCIPPELQYACVYWVHHLQASGRPLDNRVYSFLSKHFLHWLEAVSLLGQVPYGINAISIINELAKGSPSILPEFLEFAKDASKTVSRFGLVVENFPLQTYASLLFFSPSISKVRQRFWNQRLPASGHIEGIKSVWDSHLQTLEGHSGTVKSLSYSPDGKFLASASDDRTVRVWNATSGTHLTTFEGHTKAIWGVKYSPDGLFLASRSADHTVRIWDMISWTLKHTIPIRLDSSWPDLFSFTPDSQLLVIVDDDNTIQIWCTRTGTHQRTIVPSGIVSATGLSPSGQFVASASNDGSVHVWSLVSGTTQHILETRVTDIKSIVFSPNCQLLVLVSRVGRIYLWDTSSVAQACMFDSAILDVRRIIISSDSQLLVTVDYCGLVQIWSTKTGRLDEISSFNMKSMVSDIAFCPDNQVLALVSSGNTIKFWDITIHAPQPVSQGYTSRVSDVFFSPDGKIAASVSDDGIIRLWDTATGLYQKTLTRHSPYASFITFSPDNKLLVSKSHFHPVICWDIETGKRNHLLGSEDLTWTICYSTDSSLVVLEYSNTISIRDARTYSCINTLQDYLPPILKATFSPNKEILAAWYYDETIRLWDIRTGEVQCELETSTGFGPLLVFSPDSQIIANRHGQGIICCDVRTGLHRHTFALRGQPALCAFSSDTKLLVVVVVAGSLEEIEIWDVKKGQYNRSLHEFKGRATELVFSPSDQFIAVASQDRVVRLWNAPSFEYMRVFTGHCGIITIIRFSPDEKILATASLDKTIRLWEINTGMPLQIVQLDTGSIREISFTHDQFVVAVSDDAMVHFWIAEDNVAVLRDYTYPIRTAHQTAVSRGINLSVDKIWITQDDERIIRLPVDYRPATDDEKIVRPREGPPLAISHEPITQERKTWARRGSTLFIGCESGRVIRFQAA
ncbi:G-protein beta WD-40 repeat-containing protein [Fusarium heterosporum]|uniref:G-protein beta WD-40 repeat-containing protein n=1 Tax=Fusarium heterosporum TaxID=42747 RepID=A0A8H5SVI2_FUSHE|nr:G-protein beta WD-40 repeat-containing protein [Fusarium heterosporum]